MHENPLISVITVTFNASAVIERTLQSVENQNFRDYEHLIIDGKSKDDTLEKIRNHGNPKIKLVSEPDRGLYDAMNKGIRMARGNYIIFLNAGDKFHDSGTLSLYAKGCLEDKDIIYGDTVIVDNKGEFIAPRHLCVPEKLTFRSFSKGMLVCHQAFMVKRSLAETYDTDYRFSADYDWCVRILRKTDPEKCLNLHCVTIDYLSDGLTDKNKFKSLRERFRIMSRHYGFFPTLFNHTLFVFRAMKRHRL